MYGAREELFLAPAAKSVSSMDGVLTSTKNNSQKIKLINSDISEPSTVSKNGKLLKVVMFVGKAFIETRWALRQIILTCICMYSLVFYRIPITCM